MELPVIGMGNIRMHLIGILRQKELGRIFCRQIIQIWQGLKVIDKDHFFYIRRYGFCYQGTTRSIRLDENVTRMFHVVDDS